MNRIETEQQLEDELSRPSTAAIDTMRRLEGDILVLGAGGKMGPTLCRMMKRATDEAGITRRITAVSRFTDDHVRENLKQHGIEIVQADLLEPNSFDQLPDAPNILYMAARKFGATGNESMTWAMNTYLPGKVAERYRDSRVIAFSTGNVYGMVPVDSGGSLETDALRPEGEYAVTAMGRERMFTYGSETYGTQTALVRLNYACEFRYGVLVDIARTVFDGRPVDVTMGHVNVIWQGDANDMTLRCFAHAASPPFVINVTGPEMLRVRDIALRFGELFNKEVHFHGAEADTALLNNAAKSHELFGNPAIPIDDLIPAIADWLQNNGTTWEKPTKFQVRDGAF